MALLEPRDMFPVGSERWPRDVAMISVFCAVRAARDRYYLS
jgi:hypothetical protein